MTPYAVWMTSTTRRQLSGDLPEGVATAVLEFGAGPLAQDPHRAGKRMRPPLADQRNARRGTFRVLYEVDAEARVVTILAIGHRRDIYRT
jgi:mRNA interferase RelE/StbE